MHAYEVRPRKDKRGVDLISDVASRSQRSPLEQRGATPFFNALIPVTMPPATFIIATALPRGADLCLFCSPHANDKVI
jgi:hypothetical protein